VEVGGLEKWSVLIINPNRFEATVQSDVLRAAGVRNIRYRMNCQVVLQEAAGVDANIILMAAASEPICAVDWIPRFRRIAECPARKAAIFVTAPGLTASVVEACRIAGANAAIGLPLSTASLLNTITKVLAKPRPFVDCEAYVGPCRRAGIVTAGAGARRRKSDATTFQL
jgi:AmiR/NasT family two-component response regulator